MMPRKPSPLPFNPRTALSHLARADKRMARLIDAAGPLTLAPSRNGTPFRALTASIIYQQLSGKAAGTIHKRVIALFDSRAAMTPANLLALPDATLRSAGVSAGKLAALRDLARHALDGELPGYGTCGKLSDEEITERLCRVRGVGEWTAQMFLIFRLGRPDVLPDGDLGVRKGFALTFGDGERLPEPEELVEHGERWRPYRTVASWYLWRAVDLSRAKSRT